MWAGEVGGVWGTFSRSGTVIKRDWEIVTIVRILKTLYTIITAENALKVVQTNLVLEPGLEHFHLQLENHLTPPTNLFPLTKTEIKRLSHQPTSHLTQETTQPIKTIPQPTIPITLTKEPLTHWRQKFSLITTQTSFTWKVKLSQVTAYE